MDRTLSPAVVLGGFDNALSVARSLGRAGIRTTVITHAASAAHWSRYIARSVAYRTRAEAVALWRRELLAESAEPAVLFACDDEAVEFVLAYRQMLAARHRFEAAAPAVAAALLDKLETYRLAEQIGCAAPAHRPLERPDDIPVIARALRFPVLIKPRASHSFQRRFGRGVKHFVARDAAELSVLGERALDTGLPFLVCEQIPGEDDRYSYFYTSLTDDGRALYRVTTQVLRRSPPNAGQASYVVTRWLPETARIGERFLRGIGYVGSANVEVKRDPRDGALKIIECNVRFTAAEELLVRAGVDPALHQYRELAQIGSRLETGSSARPNLALWHPVLDARSLQWRRRAGTLGLAEWIASLGRPAVLPYCSARDPAPLLHLLLTRARERRWA